MTLHESPSNSKKTKIYNFRVNTADDKLFNELKSQYGFKEMSAFLRFLARNSDLQMKLQEKQNNVGKGVEKVDSKLDQVLLLLNKGKKSKNEIIKVSPELRKSLSKYSILKVEAKGDGKS